MKKKIGNCLKKGILAFFHFIIYTFFYKNNLYKNISAQIRQKNKNNLRIWPASAFEN